MANSKLVLNVVNAGPTTMIKKITNQPPLTTTNAKDERMSCREHPNSGLTVNVIKFQKFLSVEKLEQLDEFLGEHDCEQSLELIQKEFKRLGLPEPYWLFYMGEETVPGDELERENWYVLFDEDDLYIKTEKPELGKLKQKGLAPVFANWSEWG
ncbi:TPA: hypothetical protein HA278_04295 [Candidatus Woesearchaeota archaeon]|jgi:hypothetical protein|nr:hypothetical protein [Candidatus Woesearchaeota archaeon]